MYLANQVVQFLQNISKGSTRYFANFLPHRRLSTKHFNKSPPPVSVFKDCFKKLILSCCMGDFIIVYKSSRWEVINKNGFQKYFSNNIPRKATVKTVFHFQPKYIPRLFLSDNCDHPYRSWKTRAKLNPFSQSHK